MLRRTAAQKFAQLTPFAANGKEIDQIDFSKGTEAHRQIQTPDEFGKYLEELNERLGSV